MIFLEMDAEWMAPLGSKDDPCMRITVIWDYLRDILYHYSRDCLLKAVMIES